MAHTISDGVGKISHTIKIAQGGEANQARGWIKADAATDGIANCGDVESGAKLAEVVIEKLCGGNRQCRVLQAIDQLIYNNQGAIT